MRYARLHVFPEQAGTGGLPARISHVAARPGTDNDSVRIVFSRRSKGSSPTHQPEEEEGHPPNQYRGPKKHVKDKQRILSSLTLIKALEHFSYSKKDSIKVQGSRVVCSSPFASDSNPSFYYDKERKLFYDFSQGFGGDLFSLVARLEGLDIKTSFVKVLNLSAKIAGIQLADNKEAGFKVDAKGVWYQSSHDTDSQWLSTPIYVEALTRDTSSKSWGRQIFIISINVLLFRRK